MSDKYLKESQDLIDWLRASFISQEDIRDVAELLEKADKYKKDRRKIALADDIINSFDQYGEWTGDGEGGKEYDFDSNGFGESVFESICDYHQQERESADRQKPIQWNSKRYKQYDNYPKGEI